MKLFELEHKGGPFGDACTLYKMVFPQETTVRELIDYVIKQFKNEWGNIDIGQWPPHMLRLEYRYGRIISDEIPEYMKDSVILDADAYGGWTNMNYIIKEIRHGEDNHNRA